MRDYLNLYSTAATACVNLGYLVRKSKFNKYKFCLFAIPIIPLHAAEHTGPTDNCSTSPSWKPRFLLDAVLGARRMVVTFYDDINPKQTRMCVTKDDCFLCRPFLLATPDVTRFKRVQACLSWLHEHRMPMVVRNANELLLQAQNPLAHGVSCARVHRGRTSRFKQQQSPCPA